MDKRRTSISRSRRQHLIRAPLLLPAVSGSGASSDGSQQADNTQQQDVTIIRSPECYHHRNNHNSGLMQLDEVPKSTIGGTSRRRRTTMSSHNENECSHHHRSHAPLGLIPVHLNDALVILLRLIILLAAVLIVAFSIYHVIAYVYLKPKKNGWERAWFSMIDWLAGD